jgi:hypothetical protein
MAEEIGTVVIYERDGGRYPIGVGGELVIGVDVGIRNLGLSVFVVNEDDGIVLVGLYHLDLGRRANNDHSQLVACLSRDLVPLLRKYLLEAREATLAIETQEKQRGDCQMAQVAGMIQALFELSCPLTCTTHNVISTSPAECSSLAVQYFCLPDSQISAVVRTADKKDKVVEILEGYLVTFGLYTALETYQTALCRFTTGGKAIKSSDRRDHSADAFGHGLSVCLRIVKRKYPDSLIATSAATRKQPPAKKRKLEKK